MLVLTSKLNDRILVTEQETGRKMWVQLLEVRQGQVKLGFDAPREFEIVRESLLPVHEK